MFYCSNDINKMALKLTIATMNLELVLHGKRKVDIQKVMSHYLYS